MCPKICLMQNLVRAFFPKKSVLTSCRPENGQCPVPHAEILSENKIGNNDANNDIGSAPTSPVCNRSG